MVASVAFVGALPAAAEDTLRVPGFAETVIASMEPIVYVTVAVAVVAALSRLR